MRATEIFYYFDGGDLAMPGIRRLRLAGKLLQIVSYAG